MIFTQLEQIFSYSGYLFYSNLPRIDWDWAGQSAFLSPPIQLLISTRSIPQTSLEITFNQVSRPPPSGPRSGQVDTKKLTVLTVTIRTKDRGIGDSIEKGKKVRSGLQKIVWKKCPLSQSKEGHRDSSTVNWGFNHHSCKCRCLMGRHTQGSDSRQFIS